MRRILIFIFALCCSFSALADVGTPFFRNYLPAEYGAHNRNFDVACDEYGRVYVANFEGILCYDETEWRVIHTPGISRATAVFRDSHNCIWVGGYNFFGRFESSANGQLRVNYLLSDVGNETIGEVIWIFEREGEIRFFTSENGIYAVRDNQLKKIGVRAAEQQPREEFIFGYKVNQMIVADNRIRLYATTGGGLIGTDMDGNRLFCINESNGLCNNNVYHLVIDNKGYVWGPTDNGIFCADVLSVFRRYSSAEGLPGEVLTIKAVGTDLYAGTMEGLFIKTDDGFQPIPDIRQACWQLTTDKQGKLYAATADGAFAVDGRQAKRITSVNTFSVFPTEHADLYLGEMNGIYLHHADGRHELQDSIPKVSRFYQSADGTIWASNMYGRIYRKYPTEDHFRLVVTSMDGENESAYASLFMADEQLYLKTGDGVQWWDAGNRQFVPDHKYAAWFANSRFPLLSYYDDSRRFWFSNDEGRSLKAFDETKEISYLEEMLHPLHLMAFRAMEVNKSDLWLGNGEGLVHCDVNEKDIEYDRPATVVLRRVEVEMDTLIWDGFTYDGSLNSKLPFGSLQFNSYQRNITFGFSITAPSIVRDALYRYRINKDDEWSEWSPTTMVTLSNLWYGHYTFEVEARDKFGRVTTLSLPFSISHPFYMKWYSIVFYILVVTALVFLVVRWRMNRLLKEKMHLESVVEERTSQLRQQKNEIEEKSVSLQKALSELEVAMDDLGRAQNELIRQERMATVGKLTQGLIDRILNPLNYINNFSHMSEGFIKDVHLNIEDEKESFDAENYDDTVELLDMVGDNLKKIVEHGTNTTRILKAMEEMLKDRSGNVKNMDVAAICRQSIEMLRSYFAEDIKNCRIEVSVAGIDEPCMADVNGEQLNRAITSMLGNSVYALRKKYQQSPFDAGMSLTLRADAASKKVTLILRDNGIGIEQTIINKIFDPFFTTKTTAEAAGVGLYLSREIIQNIGGDIAVESVKNQYTVFTITFPMTQTTVRTPGNHGSEQEPDDSSVETN